MPDELDIFQDQFGKKQYIFLFERIFRIFILTKWSFHFVISHE